MPRKKVVINEEHVMSLKVVDLKKICKKYKLSQKGKKAVLQDCILEHLQLGKFAVTDETTENSEQETTHSPVQSKELQEDDQSKDCCDVKTMDFQPEIEQENSLEFNSSAKTSNISRPQVIEQLVSSSRCLDGESADASEDVVAVVGNDGIKVQSPTRRANVQAEDKLTCVETTTISDGEMGDISKEATLLKNVPMDQSTQSSNSLTNEFVSGIKRTSFEANISEDNSTQKKKKKFDSHCDANLTGKQEPDYQVPDEQILSTEAQVESFGDEAEEKVLDTELTREEVPDEEMLPTEMLVHSETGETEGLAVAEVKPASNASAVDEVSAESKSENNAKAEEGETVKTAAPVEGQKEAGNENVAMESINKCDLPIKSLPKVHHHEKEICEKEPDCQVPDEEMLLPVTQVDAGTGDMEGLAEVEVNPANNASATQEVPVESEADNNAKAEEEETVKTEAAVEGEKEDGNENVAKESKIKCNLPIKSLPKVHHHEEKNKRPSKSNQEKKSRELSSRRSYQGGRGRGRNSRGRLDQDRRRSRNHGNWNRNRNWNSGYQQEYQPRQSWQSRENYWNRGGNSRHVMNSMPLSHQQRGWNSS